jgi:tetratricopeptide (TPR) repeat protein
MYLTWISRALLFGCLALVPLAAQQPTLADASRHYELGRAHALRSEWDAAEQEFKQSIALRPDYVPALLALAQTQVSRGKFDEAWKTASVVIDADSGNETARLIQVTVLTGQKKMGEARQVLEGMLKANPSSPDGYFHLGVLNLTEQKYAEAEATFRRAYQLSPDNTRGLMGLVETLMAQNKPEVALTVLQAEVEKAPNRADLQLALGNTAVRAAHYDLALASYQKILSQMQKGPALRGDVYLRLGETYRRMGDASSAIQALQKARADLPNNVVVLSTLAAVLDGVGRKAEASETYGVILKLDPNNAVAINNMAFLMAETGGDLDRALMMALRAQELLPNLSAITDTLGWIFLKKGLPDNAIEMFAELVGKEPARSTFHYHLAIAYQTKGESAAALREARAAAAMHPAIEESQKIQALIAQLGK